MSFFALVWKEWRDSRTTVVAEAILCAAVAAAFHAFVPDSQHGTSSALIGRAIAPALFAAVLASDAIASDALSGRLLTQRALPVPAFVAWVARATWLGIATAAFYAWSLIVHRVALEAWSTSAAVADLTANEPIVDVVFHVGIAVAAGSFFASTLSIGGVRALVLSGMTTLVPLVVGSRLAIDAHFPGDPSHISLYAALTTAGFLVASALAFSFGRLHLGARLRTAILGWGALLVCSLPIGATAHGVVARWWTLEPGDRGLRVVGLLASPDGTRVAVQVQARDAGGDVATTAWILRVTDGEVTVLDGRDREALGWASNGLLLLSGEGDLQRFDPITGASEPATHADSPPGMTWPEWATAGRELRSVTWRDAGIREERGPDDVFFLVQHVPGCLLTYGSEGSIDRIDMGRGRRRLVPSGALWRGSWVEVSRDDRFMTVTYAGDGPLGYAGGERFGDAILDAHDGSVVRGPWDDARVTWLAFDPGSRAVVEKENGGALLLDVESGTETELGPLGRRHNIRYPNVQRLPDGRLIVLRPGGRVELLTASGEVERVLLDGGSRVF